MPHHLQGALLALLTLLLPVVAADDMPWPAYQGPASGPFEAAGNHRFRIAVADSQSGSAAVMATVPWRRSDSDPLAKNAFVTVGGPTAWVHAKHCSRVNSTADEIVIVFSADQGPGDYFLYYMPFSTCEYYGGGCGYDASVNYAANIDCNDAQSWFQQPAPQALNVTYEAKTSFDSFAPMGMPMSSQELQAFVASSKVGPSGAVVVAEDRSRPVQMTTQLPALWLQRTASDRLAISGTANPGENYTYQIAVYASSQPLNVTQMVFSDLVSEKATIVSTSQRCFNFGGIDFWGRWFNMTPAVEENMVKPLWIALTIPSTAPPGVYNGAVTVIFNNNDRQVVNLQITVSGDPIPNGGDDDITRGTRLHWLDSNLGFSGDTVPAPYMPIDFTPTPDGSGYTALLFGKQVHVGWNGLPLVISTTDEKGTTVVLDAPMTFGVGQLSFAGPNSWQFEVVEVSNMTASWTSTSIDAQQSVRVIVSAVLDCTGFFDYNVTVTALADLQNAAFQLTLPNNPANAFFAMGLGVHGGYIANVVGTSSQASHYDWLVFDFGSTLVLDGFSFFGAGDGIHDPKDMVLQVTDNPEVSWNTVASFTARPNMALQRQAFAFQATTRFVRWVILSRYPTPNCSPSSFCQSDIAEVEFHSATTGDWIVNNGTASSSIVLASSGIADPQNAAWKAADGKILFSEYGDGWDASDSAPPFFNSSAVLDWAWDGLNADNAAWVGSTRGGARLKLKGDDPLWQAGVPFDSNQSPTPPVSWSNGGAGGASMYLNGTVVGYSGARSMSEGASISYLFTLMVTPVRPLNVSKHWSQRWAQLGGPGDYAYLASKGVTVVNMHQGNEINPWINYPYLTNDEFKEAADACHNLSMKFSIYNTMRELSNRALEVWAMRSLGETYVPGTSGSGGGADWLMEQLRTDYIPAWSNPLPPPDTRTDAAIKVKALSRWNNYYVQGMTQAMRDFNADGIYLDEIAYDRVTLLRMRKVIGEGGVIDHHSDSGAFTTSPALNYMELFPFIDRLWYGEGFNYDCSPDYWLVEISGLAFGLTSDMLRYSGMIPYHYHGMLVGSSNRWQDAQTAGSTSPFLPTGLWALWDEFQIQDAEMYGWWMEVERGAGSTPVTASDAGIKVTSYVKAGEAALIVLASFSQSDITVTLNFNWSILGLDAGSVRIVAPEVEPFQPTAQVFGVTDPITVPATQGWLLIVESTADQMLAQNGDTFRMF